MQRRRDHLVGALRHCGTTAAHCAEAAAALEHIDARACEELCRDATTLCRAAAQLLERRSAFEGWVLPSALLATELCEAECERYPSAPFRECASTCSALRRAADRITDADSASMDMF